MSQENVEVVRRIIDAINRADIDAVVESATEDFVMDLSSSRGLLSGVYRGGEQAREAVEAFLEPWDSLRWEPELIELDADRVLTVNAFQMRGRGSGVAPSDSQAVQQANREAGELGARHRPGDQAVEREHHTDRAKTLDRNQRDRRAGRHSFFAHHVFVVHHVGRGPCVDARANGLPRQQRHEYAVQPEQRAGAAERHHHRA